MTFDPTKPVRTRDGRKARIVCTDRVSKCPIIALVLSDDMNAEELHIYTSNGKEWPETRITLTASNDLVNVPEKHVVFWNIYPDDFHDFLDTKEDADKCAVPGRIACLRIEFEEGEGL